ncbi:hypothetical protein OUZ56_003327 [Daphnia magna]|uniref:Uncharacterized protein n=1 Tax=Daphnia magna TaxID=35525 RepID=A0ABR0A8E7_9CRUS|nr:hypothetical protein OUZ56_003327 [Daphnia magna]
MWKTDNVNIPDNRAIALKRLYSLERRYQRDGDFAQKYDAVVKEYIDLDHARLLATEELRKDSSRTCATEVVFGAAQRVLDWASMKFEDIGIDLARLATGNLPLELFPPSQLRSVLKEIRASLAMAWAPTPALQNGNRLLQAFNTDPYPHFWRQGGIGKHLLRLRRPGYAHVRDGQVRFEGFFESRAAVVGIGEIPHGCSIQTDEWILQGSRRHSLSSTRKGNDFLPRLKGLNWAVATDAQEQGSRANLSLQASLEASFRRIGSSLVSAASFVKTNRALEEDDWERKKRASGYHTYLFELWGVGSAFFMASVAVFSIQWCHGRRGDSNIVDLRERHGRWRNS